MLYSIYGLCLDVDAAMPALTPCRHDRVPDVRVRLKDAGDTSSPEDAAESMWHQGAWRDEQTGEPFLTILRSSTDGSLRIRFADGVQFLIDRPGSDIRAICPSGATREDVALYLTGPVLGIVLRLRGVIALHASAVAIGDRAIAFVGPSGAGKSTAAAAFASLGYPVLAEDIAALQGAGEAPMVQAGYPSIALWPESAAMLFGDSDALPRFTPGWDKRCLDVAATGRFMATPRPLGAIYLLATRRHRMSSASHVVRIPPGEAMIRLLANVYGSLVLHDQLRVAEVDTIHALLTSLPVRAVVPGGDPAALCDAILGDLSRLQLPTSACCV
jgi:hypothetical protein